MNLQESIRRVLREEIDIITNLNQLRRRTYLIDDIIKIMNKRDIASDMIKDHHLDGLIGVVG